MDEAAMVALRAAAEREAGELVALRVGVDSSFAPAFRTGADRGERIAQMELGWLRSRATLCRFLRARGWRLPEASDMIARALRWRREFGVYDIDALALRGEMVRSAGMRFLHEIVVCCSCSGILPRWELIMIAKVCPARQASGKMFVAPMRDLRGGPIVVNIKSAEAARSDRDALVLVVYVLEKASRLADASGVPKWTWCLDLREFTRSSSPPLNISRETLRIMQARLAFMLLSSAFSNSLLCRHGINLRASTQSACIGASL